MEGQKKTGGILKYSTNIKYIDLGKHTHPVTWGGDRSQGKPTRWKKFSVVVEELECVVCVFGFVWGREGAIYLPFYLFMFTKDIKFYCR